LSKIHKIDKIVKMDITSTAWEKTPMKTVTATDAQSHFGELLMHAQGEPVAITRNGKAAGVMLSAKDYQELKLQALRQALIEGEESGDGGPFDMKGIIADAKKQAGLSPKHA
jgi:prevent-host-death family protein